MVRIRNGRVTAIGDRRPGATELRVALDGEAGEVPAIGYDRLTGPVAVGDRVVLNTTAVALGLGTGASTWSWPGSADRSTTPVPGTS